jgi:hypothetical protein
MRKTPYEAKTITDIQSIAAEMASAGMTMLPTLTQS